MVPNQFPVVGLKVLAVDDDPINLSNVMQMCTQCQYVAATCTDAALALNMLRANVCFDVILVELHMTSMNGYEFLQHVNQETNVPVIVMSADSTTSSVEKAIELGACDYWNKPLCVEQYRKMWQHVVRKAWSKNKRQRDFGILEDLGCKKQRNDDFLVASSIVNAIERGTSSKEVHVDGSEKFYGPAAKTKKSRLHWSKELHQHFVKAVNQIGFDKATPKTIHEIMEVPYLTRENVASHLQKFKDGLKRKAGVALQQNGMQLLPNRVPEAIKSNQGAFGKPESQVLAIAENVSNEPVSDLHANIVSKEKQSTQVEETIQWPNHAEQGVAYAQPPTNIANNSTNQSFMPSDDAMLLQTLEDDIQLLIQELLGSD
ncbi:hypothetical protein RJT34_04820 [Clitoria ternatea]|uniref:Response regulatory domain-containing protein n=1 Tax=Clitoria ternatea TaxID=43366 RepID=A0AAN9Q3S1_CLITE